MWLVGLILIKAKIGMQQLWEIKPDWDVPVPNHIVTLWHEYETQLQILNNLTISRRILINEATDIQLHDFCDASENAYGACIYLRSSNRNNHYMIKLVCSKSKEAPLRKISLLRQELCAALLLAEFYESKKHVLNLKCSTLYSKIFF